jgi:hypothetical protein
MTLGQHVEPDLLVGLEDQCGIMNQLFNRAVRTTKNRTKLERSWEVIAHEENITVYMTARIFRKYYCT